MDLKRKNYIKKILIVCCLFIFSFGNSKAQYCASTASNGDFEYINKVVIGSINNESTSSLYTDYSSAYSTDMYVGESYELIITNAQHDPVDKITCWVDWNQNQTFDENEKINLTYNGVSSQESDATGTIIPPADAAFGATKIRVMLVADYEPSPCLSFTYGEVEDYTINVKDIDATPEANFNSNKTEIFAGETIEFHDLSSMVPTAWNWIISPSTVTFIESTDHNSQNPVITFIQEGNYTITLEATNVIGTGDTTITDYIKVKPFSKPKYLTVSTEGKHVDLAWSAPNIPGSHSYVQMDGDKYVTSDGPQRAIKFTADDLNFTYPVTVTDLSAYFYEDLYTPWESDYFKFKIYDADTATVLFESDNIIAFGSMENIYTLPEPMIFSDDFFVAIIPMGTTESYTPSNYAKKVDAHTTHTFIGEPGKWWEFSNDELALEVATSIYISGDKSNTGKSNRYNYLDDFDISTEKVKSSEQVVYTLAGYKIYRDDVMIKEINDPSIKTFHEYGLANGTYEYSVKAIYSPIGESPASDPIEVTVDNSDPEFMLLYQSQELINKSGIKLSHNVDVDSTEIIEFGIYNEGLANLVIDSIRLDNDEFELVEMCDKNILTNDTSYFKIAFKPLSDGQKTLHIQIDNNDSNENPTLITINAVGGLDKWTWMLYLLEDDQGLDGIKDINEWEMNGSVDGQVNYLVLYNSNTDANDGIWYIQKDENGYNRVLVSDLVNTDFGKDPDLSDPSVLEEFLLWVKDNYPAQHYGLTMWDHGSGIFKKADNQDKGIEKGFVGEMKLWEMSKAIEPFVAAIGHKMDVIGFDVCLLGQFETTYQFRDLADYVVASELTEPGDGWDYTAAFAPMTSNPDITPEEIAISITNTYSESYLTGGSQGRSASTQAATSIKVMNDEFIPVFNELCDRLANLTYDFKTEISLAMNEAWSTISTSTGYEDNPDHRDLGGFIANVANSDKFPMYAREKASEALEIYNRMIVAEGHTEDDFTGGATGLKIWMPNKISKQGFLKVYYTDPDLYLDISYTRWDEFLVAFENPTNTSAPVAEFMVSDTAELDVSTMIINNSYFGPTEFEWAITPATFEYVNGTSNASRNPMVKFKALGKYSISLKVTNSNGSNTLTMDNCVEVVNSELESPENLTFTQDENVITLNWSSASGLALLDEGFEELTVWPQEGWVIASNDNLDGSNLDGLSDSTNTWGLCDENTFQDQNGDPDPQYIHSGVYSAAIGYKAGMQGDPFNWLITPEVTVRSNDQLSFWMWYASDDSYFTNFDVMIFADENWTSLKHYTSGSGMNLYKTQIIFSLNEYVGKNVKIAFVYQYSDGYQMAIDDIVINNSSEKANEVKTRTSTQPIHKQKANFKSGIRANGKGHTASAHKVYRDGNLIASLTDLSVNTYTDTIQVNGVYTYYITKEYSEPAGESDPSNSVTATVDNLTTDGIDDLNANSVNVYPNPAHEKISVMIDLPDVQEIRIIDISGVIRKLIVTKETFKSVDLEGFSPGIYTVQIVTKNQKINKRLIIN